jgi:DNA-directed RNA polymerase specialized sigma24 family protein
MHQTFEELVGRHIDDLYQGALFLNAGEESPAEDLVLWTVTGAFQAFRRIDGDATERWLERKLVETFLVRAGWDSMDRESMEAFSGVDPSRPDLADTASEIVEIDPEALFRSAAKLPHLARAAIWLVLFKRWRYEEVCDVLKTDVAGLKGLLQGRRVLLTAVVRQPGDRNGTDHDRTS